MRDKARLLRHTFFTGGLWVCAITFAGAQITSSRVLPLPQTESSPTASSAVDEDAAALRPGSASAVLPVETAFSVSALFEGDSAILLTWTIAPGHYLYRDKLQLLDNANKPLSVVLPPATAMTDEYFGETSVYFDSLQLRIPLARLPEAGDGEYVIQLGYQGCAKDRYCYPPTVREVRLALPR